LPEIGQAKDPHRSARSDTQQLGAIVGRRLGDELQGLGAYGRQDARKEASVSELR